MARPQGFEQLVDGGRAIELLIADDCAECPTAPQIEDCAGVIERQLIDFNVDIYQKGAARVAVEVEPFPDEVSVANNRVERSIRVVNEKVNVLYIEGNNRWEFRYITAILKRDPRLETTFISSLIITNKKDSPSGAGYISLSNVKNRSFIAVVWESCANRR